MTEPTALQKALAWTQQAQLEAQGTVISNWLEQVAHTLKNTLRHQRIEPIPFHQITKPPAWTNRTDLLHYIEFVLNVRGEAAEGVADDLLAVYEAGYLTGRFNAEAGFSVPPPTVPHTIQMLESVVENSPQTLFLLVVDGCPIGKCSLGWRAENAELVGLYVADQYRGKGLARALIQQALLTAKNRCKQAVTLTVKRQNITALRLYLRMGFRIVCACEWYDAGDDFLMVRHIAPPIHAAPTLDVL